MTKIVVLCDTHVGVRNSSDIFIENAAAFYTDVLFPHMLEHGIKRIIHLGDVFDNRKLVNFKALHSYRKTFLAKLREYNIQMDVICGNHDAFYKNTNELNALKELLGHYVAEVRIIQEPSEIEYDGVKWGLIPWIAADNEAQTMEFLKTTTATHIGGHFELNGFEVIRGVEMQHGMDPSLLQRFHAVYTGHFHGKSSKGNIHYLGAPLEFFWNDAGDPKYFHVFDTDTSQITPVLNPKTLFHKIYYDDSKTDYLQYDLSGIENKFVKIVVINKSDMFTFDRFVDRVQSSKIYELKIAETFQEFVGESIADGQLSLADTGSLLCSYVDAVDTELDKDRIKNQMMDLMIEAQSLEVA